MCVWNSNRSNKRYIQISTKLYIILQEEMKNKRESKKKSERSNISIRHYKIVLIYIDN